MLALALSLSVAGTASAQEQIGAGRVEVGIATGGGALIFAAGENVSRFGAYGIGATVTFNLNPRFGIEGDFGLAPGRRQDVTFAQTTLVNQKTPMLLDYNGTLIFSPRGTNHRVVPYLAAGAGGLTMRHAPETALLGVTSTRYFLTGNAGGGLDWYPARHLGVRGDYRLMIIRNGSDGPMFFGEDATRFAHRIYGALVLTY